MPRQAAPKPPDPAQLTLSFETLAQQVPAAVETRPAFTDLARESGKEPPLFLRHHLPIYGVKLARSGTLLTQGRPKIQRPQDVAKLLAGMFDDADREIFLSVLLDTKNQAIGISVISVGNLNSTLVHPREVFKTAILANADSIIVAHNHPSGDPTPSPEDIAVSRKLAEAGAVLGIEVEDHVIIGDGIWRSLKEAGFF
jgi:DNA repair protein RadC